VIIISAGFEETGREGAERQRQLMNIAQEHNIRVIGPMSWVSSTRSVHSMRPSRSICRTGADWASCRSQARSAHRWSPRLPPSRGAWPPRKSDQKASKREFGGRFSGQRHIGAAERIGHCGCSPLARGSPHWREWAR